jgi:hypothetical protein
MLRTCEGEGLFDESSVTCPSDTLVEPKKQSHPNSIKNMEKDPKESSDAAANTANSNEPKIHFLKADRSLRPEGEHFENTYDKVAGHKPAPRE